MHHNRILGATPGASRLRQPGSGPRRLLHRQGQFDLPSPPGPRGSEGQQQRRGPGRRRGVLQSAMRAAAGRGITRRRGRAPDELQRQARRLRPRRRSHALWAVVLGLHRGPMRARSRRVRRLSARAAGAGRATRGARPPARSRRQGRRRGPRADSACVCGNRTAPLTIAAHVRRRQPTSTERPAPSPAAVLPEPTARSLCVHAGPGEGLWLTSPRPARPVSEIGRDRSRPCAVRPPQLRSSWANATTQSQSPVQR